MSVRAPSVIASTLRVKAVSLEIVQPDSRLFLQKRGCPDGILQLRRLAAGIPGLQFA
jgi:hypothetical protein